MEGKWWRHTLGDQQRKVISRGLQIISPDTYENFLNILISSETVNGHRQNILEAVATVRGVTSNVAVGLR
jgi:hypothetical protein